MTIRLSLRFWAVVSALVLAPSASGTLLAEETFFNHSIPTTRPARNLYDSGATDGPRLVVRAAPITVASCWPIPNSPTFRDHAYPPPLAERYTFEVVQGGARKMLGTSDLVYWDETWWITASADAPSEKFVKILDSHFEGDTCFLLVNSHDARDCDTEVWILSLKGSPGALGFGGGSIDQLEYRSKSGWAPMVTGGSFHGLAKGGTLTVELLNKPIADVPRHVTYVLLWRRGIPNFVLISSGLPGPIKH